MNLIKILTLLTVLFSSPLYSQNNLSETCSKAREDIDKLYVFTTAPNPNEFRVLVDQIHNSWEERLAQDTCKLGRCSDDSPELTMSLIILTVNGLSSKLMIHRNLGVPKDLKKSIDDAKELINRSCP